MAQPENDPCGTPQHLPVNMFEASDAVVVVTPMPAVMADDVHISINGRTLTIEADCRTEAPKEYLLHEWHYGPYERTLELPEGYGGEGEGSFGNGQLALRIRKGDDAGGTRTVTVAVKG
jgi:HSP20 family molecular chaperone IbpA